MCEPIDIKTRELAVSEQYKNIVLTAGAGTGKTTILVRRILHILLAHKSLQAEESPIRKIVALTFTEKAASEMKIRIMEELEKIAAAMNGACNQEEKENVDAFINDLQTLYHTTYSEIERRVLRSLQDMDKAMICTIHSFAAYVLRMFPVESGVTPDFTVDEGSIFEDLFEKEWAKWLDRELSLTSGNTETWKNVLARMELASIKSLAKRLSDFAIPLETLKQEADASSSIIHTLITPYCNTIDAFISKCENPNNKLLLQLQELSNIFKALKTHGIDYLNNVTYDFEKAISKAKTGWDEKDLPLAQDIIKKCRTLLRKLQRVDESFIKALLNLILPFAKTFQQIYLSEGYVSFDGLLTLTRNLLQNNAYCYVRAKLKNEYKAILVDEFQDTDPMQYDIILFLSEKRKHHSDTIHNITLEPGKLFIVGDPKQSIYSFRRADIEAYEHVVKQICDNETPLNLQENFRSHSGIVNAVNDLFCEKIITEQHGLQPKYIPIHANRVQTDHFQRVEIISVSDGNGEELNAETAREAEADWIAKWIKNNVYCSSIYNTTENNTLPKLKYKDIALLLRSFTQIRPYIESLKEHNIPFIVEGEKYFYTTQEVIDFMNLLRTIENPFDTIALVGILRSPFAGLTDNEIYLLKTNELLDYRKTISNEIALEKTIDTFYTFLRKYQLRSKIIPVSRLISEIIHDPHFTSITASSWQGEQKLANLHKFYQIACKLEQIQDISLKHFINSMKKHIEEAKEEGESPLSDETLDVVKVLTIHKSKGLEFPVVILGNLHGEVKKDTQISDSAVFDWNTSSTGIVLGKNEQQLRNLQSIIIENKINARSWEEEKRVLYVAMTRAKERLILTGALKNNNKSYIGLITKSLYDAYGIQLNNKTNAPSDQPQKIIFGASEIFLENFKYDGARRFVSKPTWKKSDIDWNVFIRMWEYRKQLMLAETEKPLFISATILYKTNSQTHYDVSACNKPDSSEEMRQKYAATIGSLCHQIMEEWDFQGTSQQLHDLTTSLITNNFYSSNNDPTIINFIQTEIVSILSGFFDSEAYHELKKARIKGREIPILLQWDGQIMRGTIDIIYELEGITIIGDYKTDLISLPDEKTSIKTDEINLKIPSPYILKYQIQKKIYTEAVRRCLKINDPVFKIIFLRIGKSVLI